MEARLGWDGRWKMADGAGRAERRKAMETAKALVGFGGALLEPGGQNAERQWRLERIAANRCAVLWSREGRTPKGNGDVSFSNRGLLAGALSREGRTPKGNGDQVGHHGIDLGLVGSREGRTPKGKGDGAAIDNSRSQMAEAGRAERRKARETGPP
jgi:hypothetical protein